MTLHIDVGVLVVVDAVVVVDVPVIGFTSVGPDPRTKDICLISNGNPRPRS